MTNTLHYVTVMTTMELLKETPFDLKNRANTFYLYDNNSQHTFETMEQVHAFLRGYIAKPTINHKIKWTK
jgi:hypothetical protein|tara:strand:- start:336 stop:545 length:210 start_codon:yes stop_codon:yes gene_type:complete